MPPKQETSGSKKLEKPIKEGGKGEDFDDDLWQICYQIWEKKLKSWKRSLPSCIITNVTVKFEISVLNNVV